MPSDSSTIKTERTSGTGKSTDAKDSQSYGRWKRVLPIREAKFEGRCRELQGHIYDCSDSLQADRYTKSTKELAEHVGRTYRYGDDMRIVIERMVDITIAPPADPKVNATKTEVRVWEKRVDEYVKRTNYYVENKKNHCTHLFGVSVQT